MAQTTKTEAHFGPWHSIDEIRRANQTLGHHFFDRDTMRFFRSRILSRVYGRRYFVTSERFESRNFTGPRNYTVRKANDLGDIDDVGCFNVLTKAEAQRLARRCAEIGEEAALKEAESR